MRKNAYFCSVVSTEAETGFLSPAGAEGGRQDILKETCNSVYLRLMVNLANSKIDTAIMQCSSSMVWYNNVYTIMRGLRHCLFCIKGNARASISGISKLADSRAFFYVFRIEWKQGILGNRCQSKTNKIWATLLLQDDSTQLAKVFSARKLLVKTKYQYTPLSTIVAVPIQKNRMKNI